MAGSHIAGSGRRLALMTAAVAVLLTVTTGPRDTRAASDIAALDRPDLVPPSSECSFTPQQVAHEPLELWRTLSRNADYLAQTSPDATRSSKHRAARPGKIIFPTAVNFIDDEIFARMAMDGIAPTMLSSDAEFLRRVSIDLTGTIPDVATVNSFLADKGADKRDRMIESLLASDAFADRWSMWFGDLVENVQTSTNSREYYVGRNLYAQYIKDSIKAGKPYDQMVREIITGTGDSFASGPSNFWVRQIQPNGPIQDTYDNLAASTGDKFLGLPLQCVSCHNGFGHLEQVNSYLAKRPRQDFWRAAAFFSQSASTSVVDPVTTLRHSVIADNTTGSYKLNTTSGNKTPRTAPDPKNPVATPAFFLTGEQPAPGENWRAAYARMLTADPQFARTATNRIWKEIFGLGIVEPIDSFDLNRQDPATLAPGATLQPTHPQLLIKLSSSFVSSGFDIRALLRTMVRSSTYQLASRYAPGNWNEAWTPYYARHYPRRIMAEATLDSVFRATGVSAIFSVQGMPQMSHAMSLPDTTELGTSAPYGRFLNSFGRGNRDDIARSSEGSIIEALTLMDDTLITTRVKATTAGSTVQNVLKVTKVPAEITDALYVATLSRHPNATEQAAAVAWLKGGDITRRTEDLQYVLLNKIEFLFN